MEPRAQICRAKDLCLSGQGLNKEQIMDLLHLDPDSADAAYLRQCAGEAARMITGGAAYLWGALGIDRVPCSMNCKFCSFGEAWNLIDAETRYSEAEILEQVEAFVRAGVRFIVLRTTEFYSIESLCREIQTIREKIPGEYEIILNTGEFNLPIAQNMHAAGVSGIYHALRLREGIDTGFDPQDRLNTLQAICDSPLKLISLVEPAGPEHTNEELAEAFLVTARYGAYVSGTMARVPVQGTPLGSIPMLSENRIAQLTAVFRLAAGRRIPNICVHPASRTSVSAGANVIVIERGAIPRDCDFTREEWNSFTVDEGKKFLAEAGYKVHRKEFLSGSRCVK